MAFFFLLSYSVSGHLSSNLIPAELCAELKIVAILLDSSSLDSRLCVFNYYSYI